MNPARTFASALPSGIWTAMWIYFTASPIGMLLAAQGYLLVKDPESIRMLQASPSIRPALHLLRPTYPPEGSGTDNLSLGAPLKHSLIQSFVHERAADFQGNVVAEM
jgi:hypothetical protein